MSLFTNLKNLFQIEKTPEADRRNNKSPSLKKPEPKVAKGTVISRRSPEMTGLEIAEQEAWEVKKSRIFQIGDAILDTYKVEDIKLGGMGYVYIAEHLKWKIKMAIKSPNEMMLSDKSFFARVLREADAWTDLGLHPHIAYCYYVRQIEDIPHIFIEYVDGGNLREWIADMRCYDLKVGLDLAIQFCHGMEYAHKFGMIHRDIKPENILMTKDGILKVTDFGIAKIEGSTVEEQGARVIDQQRQEAKRRHLTTLGTRMGSYDYMSPEQWEDPSKVDRRTDIYSFGVCMYEMFCGRKPYDSASEIAASFIAQMEERKPYEPNSLREDIPPKLAHLLKICIALKRRKRYTSFEKLRKELIKIYHELFDENPPRAEVEAIELKADGLNNRGVSYLDLGREEDAIECWQVALEEDPKHLEANFNYGYIRWQKGEISGNDYITQMRELETSHRVNPGYWRCLGWIHFERGDVEAVERIQKSEYKIEDEGFKKVLEDKDGPVGRLLRTLEGHTGDGDVTSVCFSPDGCYALSGGKDVRL